MGRIAQFLSCLGLLLNLGYIARSLPGNESPSELDAALVEANKGGPHMITSNVRFDRAVRNDRIFVYMLTITGPSHVPTTDELAKARSQLADGICSNTSVKRLLLTVDSLKYVYGNDNGQQLFTYNITRGDCP